MRCCQERSVKVPVYTTSERPLEAMSGSAGGLKPAANTSLPGSGGRTIAESRQYAACRLEPAGLDATEDHRRSLIVLTLGKNGQPQFELARTCDRYL